MEKKKKPWLKYVIATAIGFAVMLLILNARGVFAGGLDQAALYGALCDGFFVPGILILCIGCMIFVSQQGAFDALSFGVKLLINLLKPSGIKGGGETFTDYKARKAAEPHSPFGFLILVGGLFMIVAVVFQVLFNSTL